MVGSKWSRVGRALCKGSAPLLGRGLFWGGKQLRTLFQLCPWHSYGFPNHFLNDYLQASEKMRVVCMLFSLTPVVLGCRHREFVAWLGCLVAVTAGPGAPEELFRRDGDYSGDQARAFPLRMGKSGKTPPPWTALGLVCRCRGRAPVKPRVCRCRGLGVHSCFVAPGCFPDRVLPGMLPTCRRQRGPGAARPGLELSMAAPLALGVTGGGC